MSLIKPQYSIAELVPHTENMSLLDEVICFTDDSLTARVSITEDSEFLNEDNEIPAWIGIEYMAQTIAAWAGIQAKIADQPVKIGFLLGTRKYTSNVSSYPVGSILDISVKLNYQSNGLGAFECSISSDQLLAEANLSVYQP